MYKRLYLLIEKAYAKKIDATGLGLFRIAFFSVLLFEVVELYHFRHLIFDEIPYIRPYEISFTPLLILWIGCLLFVIAGFKTRYALIVNYILSLACIGTISTYEYHMFYSYMGVGFLSLFIPMGKAASVDQLIAKSSLITEKSLYSYPKTSVINYYALLFAGVGLVYFDSIFHKIVSFHWMNGLGVWYPSSIPQIVISDFTPLLNMKGLMLFMGYLTVVFEGAFIFIFWYKWSRIPLVLIGMGLHIGIYLVYPIPYFALGVAALYILMVPVSVWKYLRKHLKIPEDRIPYKLIRKLTFTNRPNQTGATLRKLRVHLVALGLVFFCLAQLLCIYQAPSSRALVRATPLAGTFIDKTLKEIYQANYKILTTYFGLGKHPVFMDGHFKDYNHLIAIKYDGEFLPITRENGMPGTYLRGGTWIKWTWRSNAPALNMENLKTGIRDFTAFWAYKNGVTLNKVQFDIIVKKVEVPGYWEKDFLKNQLSKPWQELGVGLWKNRQFELVINRPQLLEP
jgi:hypothetical protein